MDGYTPLHVAVSTGNVAIARQLIASRCNINLQSDIAGNTALQMAQQQGQERIATLIRNQKPEMPLLGKHVVINGLVAKPELNGRTGTALRFDDDKGRYDVELDETSVSFLIKPCNLLPTVCRVTLYSLFTEYTTKALLTSFSYCRLEPKSSWRMLKGL